MTTLPTYKDEARNAGYEGSDEKLEAIGMAIERGDCAWSWFEGGNDKFDVAAIFQYRDEEPNYEDTIGAYAEGMANEFND